MDEPAPEGASRYREASDAAAGDIPLFIVALNLTREASVGIVSAWLYDKMKSGHLKTISCDRKEIHCDEGEIRKVLEEHILGTNGDA